MARDYKNRSQRGSRKPQRKQTSVTWWRWLLIAVIVLGFALFLKYLSDSEPELQQQRYSKPLATRKPVKRLPVNKPKKKTEKNPVEPQFDFYTILPESEVVVPDFETKTRAREERIGKAKAVKYMMQAGAFREFKEADKLRARLALLGIESKIEKAGAWNRVKIGPYAKVTSVNRVKERLKQHGIGVIVTEING